MKNTNFALLLAGQGVSQIGDKFHMIALAIWVLQTTGSSARMGMVLAASLIPSLVIGLFSGVAIDRYNRKAIIVGTDLFRGVLIAGFAVLFYMELMTFPLVLVMQVLLSVNAAFFDPAIPAVIPSIVPKAELARANSRHQFINSFSMIFGAFAGGLAVAHFGFFWVFVINAVSFLISAAFESLIDIPRRPGQKDGPPAASGMAGFLNELAAGYQYIFAERRLIILLLMVGVIHFFVGSIEVIMPVMAQYLGGDTAENLGLFHGALGAGGVIMALVISRFSISGFEKTTLFGSVFVIGLLYAAAGVVSQGASGSVFAVAGSLGNASIPAAMIIYGLLLENISPEGLLLASGLLLMGISFGSHALYKEKENDGKRQTHAGTRPWD